MIYVVPTRILTPESIRAIKQRASVVMQNVSQRQNGGTNVIGRDLTATDLLVGPGPNPASNVADMSNGTIVLVKDVYSVNLFPLAKLQQGQVAVIYGFAAREATPHIQEMRVTVGTKPVAQLRLSAIYSYTDAAEGVFSEPIYWTQNQTIDIRALADAAVAASTEVFELRGFIAEKTGDTVDYQDEIDPAQAQATTPATPFAVAA